MNKQAIIFTMLALVTLGLVAQPPRSYKRGVSENNFTRAEEINSLARGVTWFYNWGNLPNSPIAGVVGPGTDMEYVPMIWSANFDEARLRAYLTEHPGVKYLLGYNEPNFRAQANMTPDSAAALWPIVEKIAEDFNLKLVAPALNYSGEALSDGKVYQPNEWMDAFLAAYPEAHFDYLALHCYMNSNVGQINYVENFAKRYGKQVWLTEFCSWEGNVDSLSQQAAMALKIQDLELSPYVYRYAWFKAKGTNSVPYYRLLITPNVITHQPPIGTLSGAGQIYTYMSAFDTTYYWRATDVIPAKDYVYSSAITIGLNTDTESDVKLQLNSFDVYSFTDYLIDVPTTGKYSMLLRNTNYKFLYAPQINVIVDDVVVAQSNLPTTANGDSDIDSKWKTHTIQNIQLTAGKHRLRLRSNRSTTCKLGWFQFVLQTIPGDVNGDGSVDGNDLNDLINVVLGKTSADTFDGRANVDGQGDIDGNDLNMLINILLGK
jgi:hypothetical protein